MKINGIKALDYQCQGDSLTLVLSETTFDAVSNLNTALVEVRTDDGDLVEAHGGYALRAITYDKDKQMQHRRAPRKSSRSSASHTPRVSSIRSALSMTLRLPSLLSRPSRRTRKYRLQSKKSRPRPAWRKRPSSICSHTNTANSS